MKVLYICVVILLALLPAGSTLSHLSEAQMIDYLVQSICLDETGAPTDALPIDQDCLRARPQRSDDVSTYRKHDWPNFTDAAVAVRGYQASDSVLHQAGRRSLIVQTFDFGDSERIFGRFDGGRGDGGQVVVLVGDWSSIAMTEDGAGGVQWFIGQHCRSERRFLGWLMFRGDVGALAWNGAIARLNVSSRPDTCPTIFNPAFTRYRRGMLAFPFQIVVQDKVVRSLHRRTLDIIVSEHYGGEVIGSADHLERFFHARGLGLVRWERWANAKASQEPGLKQVAQEFAQTSRCPQLAADESPGREWLLVDCRTWTTIVRPSSPWTVKDFNWPALGQFNNLD